MASTKKPTKRPAATSAKPMISEKEMHDCGEECCCHHHRHGGIKKLIIFVLGAVVGAAICCAYCCKDGKMMMHRGFHKEVSFVNGCADLSKVKNPKMIEKIQSKDADKNGCITTEEFFSGDKCDKKMDHKMGGMDHQM